MSSFNQQFWTYIVVLQLGFIGCGDAGKIQSGSYQATFEVVSDTCEIPDPSPKRIDIEVDEFLESALVTIGPDDLRSLFYRGRLEGNQIIASLNGTVDGNPCFEINATMTLKPSGDGFQGSIVSNSFSCIIGPCRTEIHLEGRPR